MDTTLAIIDQVIKVTGLYNKRMNTNDSSSEESLFKLLIDKAKIHIEHYISESSTLMKRVINDKKRHLEIVESTYSNTIASLKTQNTSINTVFDILSNNNNREHIVIDESLIQDVTTPVKKQKKISTKK
jgi:hypothetical protein